jgi:branched-chain amino acid transport system substrate-binding protein
MQADDQNKPDVASSLARQWIDTEDVSLLLDGASSPAALAIQQVSREKKRVYCTTSSIATALVGKPCSPYSFQFFGNASSLSKGVAGTLTEQGNKTWFFIASITRRVHPSRKERSSSSRPPAARLSALREHRLATPTSPPTCFRRKHPEPR